MKKQEFNALPENERRNRVLTGIAYFASIHEPNMSAVVKFKGLPKYKVSLGLDPEGVKLAQSFGLTVKDPTAKIPMPWIEIKRDVRAGKSIEEVAPDVMDAMQRPIPPAIKVGNGSKILCKFGTYWYDTMGGGVGTSLYKVQVLSLVPYTGGDKTLAMDEQGFNIDDFLASSKEDESIDDAGLSAAGEANILDQGGDLLPWEEQPLPAKSKSKKG